MEELLILFAMQILACCLRSFKATQKRILRAPAAFPHTCCGVRMPSLRKSAHEQSGTRWLGATKALLANYLFQQASDFLESCCVSDKSFGVSYLLHPSVNAGIRVFSWRSRRDVGRSHDLSELSRPKKVLFYLSL